MDPLTNLYERLRQQVDPSAKGTRCGNSIRPWPEEPPLLEDWLRYWNDEDTDLGNLRNFEHWIARGRPGV